MRNILDLHNSISQDNYKMSIQVQTTHNVLIDYEPASSLRRTASYLIDLCVIILWIILWLWIWGTYIHLSFDDLIDGNASWTFYFILTSFPALYDLIFETCNHGQSIGKMLLKIRVVKLDGSSPDFSAYILRWLFRPIDISMTNGILAFILVAATNKGQRIGDLIAGTTVVDLQVEKRNRRLTISDLDFSANYRVTYPNVINALSDKDIQTILFIISDRKNKHLVPRLTEKVKMLTGYTFDEDRVLKVDFLQKTVDDYHYLVLEGK